MQICACTLLSQEKDASICDCATKMDTQGTHKSSKSCKVVQLCHNKKNQKTLRRLVANLCGARSSFASLLMNFLHAMQLIILNYVPILLEYVELWLYRCLFTFWSLSTYTACLATQRIFCQNRRCMSRENVQRERLPAMH